MKIVALSALAVLVLAAPATASFPDNSAVLFSTSNDSVGKGLPRFYTDQNAAIAATGAPSQVRVSIDGFNGSSVDMSFGARSGSTIQPGSYKNAVRAAVQGANRPVMDISVNGSGCNTITGNFEVKDIAFDSSGAVQRLQILYEQHCEGAQDAVFGEVRFGKPAVAAAVATPSEVRWPAANFGATEPAAGVALLVASPMSVSNTWITGPDAEDFTIASFTCTGTCPVPQQFDYGDVTGPGVRFTPRRPGNRSATLHILDSNGYTYDVPLGGSTSP